MSGKRNEKQSRIETVNRKQKYKELIEIGSKVSDNVEHQDVLETFHNILNIVNTCETLSSSFVKDGKIENTADYLMDVQILKMSHDIMGNTAQKMGNSDFCEEEFILALKNLFTMDSGEHDYSKLADIAVNCCKTSHFHVPLLGAVDFEAGPRPEKIRKETQRHKKNDGPAKAPINVKQLSKSNKGVETINLVRTEIQKICRKRKTNSLPYFELICDPKDFMKSIGVAFQISFLVRDGFLGLKKVGDEPYIFLYDPDPESQQSQRNNPSDTVQCVMSMNPKMWKEKVKKFKIRKPLLKFDDEEETQEKANEQMDTDSD